MLFALSTGHPDRARRQWARSSSSSRSSRRSSCRAATRTSPAGTANALRRGLHPPLLRDDGRRARLRQGEQGGRGRGPRGHDADRDDSPATTTTAGEAPSEYANGDPVAGKAVFAKSGCGACHVLKAAGSDRRGRPEPRRGEAGRGADRRPRRERQGRDAAVQGAARRQADRGRRRVRRRVDAQLDVAPFSRERRGTMRRPWRSGRVAEGGALLRRYGGLNLHRGFESLLLR